MPGDSDATALARRKGAAAETGPVGSANDILLGDVPCRIYRSIDAQATPALLYVQGGTRGFEDQGSRDRICWKLATDTRCAVLSIPCRREPRSGFPAPFEDAISAWSALVGQASSLNLDPARLGIVGDGAGATLAAAVALACCRDDPALRPRLQILLRPSAEATGAGSPDPQAVSDAVSDVFATAAMMRRLLAPCVPDAAALADRQASCVYAEAFASLPAALVLTEGLAALRGEGLAYAAMLADAGNELTHVHWPDPEQGQPMPASDSAWTLAAAFVRKHLRVSDEPGPQRLAQAQAR